MAFQIDGLTVSPELEAALTKLGIEAPTPIQRAAVPVVLAGKDVLIQSGTGTGKTLAYVLPLLQRVREDATFRALILAPSPELAIQILRQVELVKEPSVSVCSLVGGANTERQKERLKKHPRVMVGTPGRVCEFIFTKKLKTRDLAALVIDETDEVLSLPNENALREIASRPEFNPQVIFASATFGALSMRFASELMNPDFVHVNVSERPLPDTITHYAATYEANRKEVWLLKHLKAIKARRAMVFVNKLNHVPHLYRFLNEHGVTAVALSSDRGKRDRAEAIGALKTGGARVLVATDAAARGLDVQGLDWVIHYDPAREVDVYVHRTGRTGRGGQPGAALTMVNDRERFLLAKYGEALGISFLPLA